MPLPFTIVCDLLEESHRLCLSRNKHTPAVIDWFARHRGRIDAYDTNLAALLSTLLPEKRTDRVYCIRAASLEKIIGRALILGISRIAELSIYKKPGLALDLGDCVERILTATPNPQYGEKFNVTVEEIDTLLHGLASKIKWSSPSIRASNTVLTQRDRSDLETMYRRFSAREAKWFTRLVLKDFQPLILDSNLIYRLCDPALPSILKIREDFAKAIDVLQETKSTLLPNSSRRAPTRANVLTTVLPKLGIKVGRQQWFKGRSIKHCIDMGHGLMSVEEKVDGEYCQIHIDVSKGRSGIQIFSKSGKDSTEDRLGLHGVILDSLKVGRAGSNIRKQCILEGELVVYSDTENRILPFHKIRNHVTRRGRFLNGEMDSKPQPGEHLMIVYYDILLLDNQSLLNVRHSDRFKLLEKTVFRNPGRAELVDRQVINFSHKMGPSGLRKAFAKAITHRGEGLVLKLDTPYFNIQENGGLVSGVCIKLKKEYIGKFGDVGDFAVVGAGFHPTTAKNYSIPNVKWTHFYIGCLNNKEEVKRWGKIPEFTVVHAVEFNEGLLKTFMSFGDLTQVPLSENVDTKLLITPGVQTKTPLAVAFRNPLVVDIRCFSFDKPGNTGFWSPRFPVVTKIHFDRDFSDTISFDDLQVMAKEATTNPELEDSQENLQWIAKLEGADPRGVPIDAVSQLTATTMPTPSPQGRSQSIISCSMTNSQATVRSRDHILPSPDQCLPDIISQTILQSPVSLVTPPTSSAPADPTSSAPIPNQRKRPLPSSCVSPVRKRRKSIPENGRLSPLVEIDDNTQDRVPLGEVPGNGSQRSFPFFSCLVKDSPKPSTQSLPQPSPTLSQAFNKEATESDVIIVSSDEDSLVLESCECNDSAGFLQANASQSRPTTASSQPNATQTLQVSHFAQARTECKYAGVKCSLAERVIFMPSELLRGSKEAARLLRAHGVRDVVVSAAEWIKKEHQSLSQQSWTSTPSKILLVDSMGMKAEMGTLLLEIEAAREEMPAERIDWISVYDWRVLKHLAISEDDSVTRKYYDGFHDPWRRWYCGLV